MPDIGTLAEFHFLRPWWLAGIVAAALLHFALGRRLGAQRQWRGIIAAHLLPHLIVNRGRDPWFAPRSLLALTFALACVALAGPAWQRERPPFVEDRAPLVIAVDLSPTMNAVDVAPTRLARAKQKVRDLIALRAGARTALIAYTGDAHVVLPFTDDAKILTAYVDALATELMPVAGRKPAAALAAAESLLASEPTPGSILFITDGFPEADRQAFVDHSHASENGVFALAVGTPQGGPMRTGPGRYAQAAGGEKMIARLDAAGLEGVANAAGATLVSATFDRSDVERIQRTVQTRLEQAIEQSARTRWRDAGYWLTWSVLLLVACSFRRGWTVRW